MKLLTGLFLFVIVTLDGWAEDNKTQPYPAELVKKAQPITVKLNEIRTELKGALISSWGETSGRSAGVNTNSIFIVGLPKTIATGDTWEGQITRSGVYKTTNGEKIPRFLVVKADHKKKEELNAMFDVKDNIFLVKTDKGNGTGIRCVMDEMNYILTTFPLIYGARKIEISDQNGVVIVMPEILEVSEREDLIRFPINSGSGLELKSEVQVGDPIFIYDNVQNSESIKEMRGEVIGLESGIIKLSCELSGPFALSRGGSPVIGITGKVVGISSFTIQRESMYYEKERPANVKSLILSLTNEQKWNSLPLNTFNAEARSLSNTEQSLEQIMDLAVQFQGEIKMQQLVSTTAERMKAQNKVKLAIDSCNNPRLRETQKYWLFFTSLAEACECVRDENREFWDTSWARNKYKKISEMAESYAQQLREFRDKRGWSVYHW